MATPENSNFNEIDSSSFQNDNDPNQVSQAVDAPGSTGSTETEADQGLQIEKLTNGVDADTAEEAAIVGVGGPITWTYAVTNNTGTPFAEADISVTDDQGLAPILDASTDTGSDSVLSPGETWTYSATGTGQDLNTVIDFEQFGAGDRGSTINNGLSGLTISTTSPQGLMVFDTEAPTGNDPDLGTPNQDFDGPGIGSGGGADSPGANYIPQGKVLILSEDGDASDPDDDAQGGTITFEWDEPVRINHICVLDIDAGESGSVVITYDADGNELGVYELHPLGDNSSQVVAIGDVNVSRMEVTLVKSGAISEIDYDRVYTNVGTVTAGDVSDSDPSTYFNPVSGGTTIQPESVAVELLTPASDPVFGDSNAIIDLVFARAGSDVIYGYDPGVNDGTTTDIDLLFGDLFDNTAAEFATIVELGSGNLFAILDTDIPSVGEDRFVLGDEFRAYYTNPDVAALIDPEGDFLGFNQFSIIYDFVPGKDTIQLNGDKDDYLLIELDNVPLPIGSDPINFSGEALFSIQSGVPDLVSLIVSKPEVDLSLEDEDFRFVGNQPADEPEDKKIGQLSSPGQDGGTGITVDDNGYIYATGSTSSSLFGKNKGLSDVWVAKYDSNGNQIFGLQFGTEASDGAEAVVTEVKEVSGVETTYVYLAGSTGAALVDGGKADATATSEAWVGKYEFTSSGLAEVWGRQVSLPGAFSTSGFGLQVDGNSNVYLSGLGIKENAFPQIFDFTVEDDSWLTKFDSDGNQQWFVELDTLFFQESYDLAVDENGNSYFIGWTQGIIDFGSPTFDGTPFDDLLPSNPAFPQEESDPSRLLLKYDPWLTKVDTNGTIQWINQFGAPNTDDGIEFSWGIDTDSSGNIYVSGWTVAVEGETQKDRDIFLAKFDPSGTQQLFKTFGTPGDDGGFLADLTIDDSDHVYLTGYTNDSLGEGPSDESFNAWVGKFTPDGEEVWIQQFGVKDKYDSATGLVVADGFVYVTGSTEGYLGSNGSFSAGGAFDAFIAKLNADDGDIEDFGQSGTRGFTKKPAKTQDSRQYNLQSTAGSLPGSYGDLGFSLGDAFDPTAENSIQQTLKDTVSYLANGDDSSPSDTETADAGPSDIMVGLYDTKTDTLIQELGEGTTEIAASKLAGRDVTIAAYVRDGNSLDGRVESVYLNLNDGEVTQTENVEPYALFGDNGGDFKGSNLQFLDSNTIRLDLYSENRRGGSLLDTVVRNFKIIEDTATDGSQNNSTKEINGSTPGDSTNESPVSSSESSPEETSGASSGNSTSEPEISSTASSPGEGTGDSSDSALIEVGLYDTNADTLITTLKADTKTIVKASDLQGRDVTLAAVVPGTSPLADAVESVYLDLNYGEVTRTENVEPYALFSDNGGDFKASGFNWSGTNTVSFALYSENKKGGTLLGTVVRDFEITNDLDAVISSQVLPSEEAAGDTLNSDSSRVSDIQVGLYDADSDALIQVIRDGEVIQVSTLPSQNLAIAALMNNSSPLADSVESMRLNFNDGQLIQTESVSPYALFGDKDGDFKGGSLPRGIHTLSFDLYDQNKASGNLLDTEVVSFQLV